MGYVDAWAAAVPNANKEAFREHSAASAAVFKECGAVAVVNCWGTEVPGGDLTSFPLAVKCGPDETVVFGWIAWPSRDARDAVWEQAMGDPRLHSGGPPPFDGKRLIFGGFETIVDV